MDLRLSALVGDQRLGPFAVDASSEIAIGRDSSSDLVLDEPWVPRRLASLVSTDHCWLLINGPSVPMRVHNKWMEAEVSRRATVAIPEGVSDLSWPALADPVHLKLRVGPGVADGLNELGAFGTLEELDEAALGGAQLTVHPVPELEPSQRRAMAVLFRHLIDGSPKPRNLIRAAAEELGTTEDALKKQLKRVKDRLNRERFQKLNTTAEVGEYLVNVAGLVSSRDLASNSGRDSVRRVRPRDR